MKNIFVILGFIALGAMVNAGEGEPAPAPLRKTFLLTKLGTKQIKSENVDLTAEHVTPIFEEMKEKLDKSAERKEQNYELYTTATEDGYNDRMLITYTVTKPEEVGGKYSYSAKITAINDFAVEMKDKFHV